MKAQRKVLFITGTLLYGGVEKLIVATAKELKRRGNYYPIICNLSGREMLHDELRKSGIEFYSLNREILSKRIIGTTVALLKLLKELRPDLIHTHQYASDFFGRLASIGLRIPVVSHIHNPYFPNRLRRWVDYLLSIQLSAGFIAVTDEKAQRVKRQIPSMADRVFVLYNAVDANSLRLPNSYNKSAQRKKWCIPEDAFLIGSVGRLSEEKGFDLLIQAFKIMVADHLNTFLMIVGSGNLEPILKDLAERLEVTNRVVFTGYHRPLTSLC